jgi:hypothetical protein
MEEVEIVSKYVASNRMYGLNLYNMKGILEILVLPIERPIKRKIIADQIIGNL